jgi:hypothetical protein
MRENAAVDITALTRRQRRDSPGNKTPIRPSIHRAGSKSSISPMLPSIPSHRKRKIPAPHNAPERALLGDNDELELFNICALQFVYYLSESSPPAVLCKIDYVGLQRKLKILQNTLVTSQYESVSDHASTLFSEKTDFPYSVHVEREKNQIRHIAVRTVVH